MAAWASEHNAGPAQEQHPNESHEHDHHHDEAVDPRLLDHASNPRNMGDLEDPSGVATGVGVCGDSLEVFLLVNGERVHDIKVRPKGCLYTIACASAMSELVQGRSLDRVLHLEPQDVDKKLGGLPDDHQHCARLAVNTLGEALEDYYRRVRAPGKGEKA